MIEEPKKEAPREIPALKDMAKYINIFMSSPMTEAKEKLSKAMVEDAGKLIDQGASFYGPYFLMVIFSVVMSRVNMVMYEGEDADVKAVIHAVNAILESYGVRRQ